MLALAAGTRRFSTWIPRNNYSFVETTRRAFSRSKGKTKRSIVFPSSFCAHCYLPLTASTEPIACPQCRNRIYCSEKCQQTDYSTAHKLYCGKSGEINIDYKIAPVDDIIGSGLFALRDFQKNNVVMHERPIVTLFNDEQLRRKQSPPISPNAKAAIRAMLPHHGSLSQKMDRNAIDVNDEEAGLFLVMALANHDCLGNTDHFYIEDYNVRIFVASQDISQGQEIRHHYTEELLPRTQRRQKLIQSYGIDCTCALCSSMELEEQARHAYNMSRKMESLVERPRPQPRQAVEVGEELIQFYDKTDLTISTKLYMWAYFDLFRAAIMRKETVEQAVGYLKHALQLLKTYTGTDQLSIYKRIEKLIASPETHKSYLKAER